jgi:hypothetical protein
MQLITLAEVLHALNSTADPCTIVFSTADRQRRTGGELVTLEGCVKTGVDREARPTPAPAAGQATPATPSTKRRPNHRGNQTINLTILSSGKVRTVHVRLITEFNGKKVRW